MQPAQHEVSAKIFVAIRDFARAKLPEREAHALVRQAFERVGLEPSVMDSPDAWLPLDALTSLRTSLAPRLGDRVIEHAMVWGIPRRREFSAMRWAAVATPQLFYGNIERTAAFFVRHLRFETVRLERGSARFRMHYEEGVPRTADSCAVARACLASIPVLHSLPHASIDETACYADGAPACEYEVRWREFPNYSVSFAVTAAVLALIGGAVAPSGWWWLLPIVAFLAGRELYRHHVQRYTSGVLDEQRRALVDNEVTFQRRYDELAALKNSLELRVQERTREITGVRDGLSEENTRLREAMMELDQLQDELVHAGLQGVIGELVGDFAHEVSNPLSALSISLSVLEAGLPNEGAPHVPPHVPIDEFSIALRSMHQGLERIRSVLAWFVEAHQSETVQTTVLDLNHEVRETVDLIARLRGDGVMPQLDLCPNAEIEAYGRQPIQVITNLVTNAIRAAADRHVWVSTQHVGEHVIMSVRDDGVGMQPEVLARIFDRGFTTHAHEGGSGIGLYVTRAIVARHGGHIDVESEPGRGTNFSVYWPVGIASGVTPALPRD